MKNWRDLKRFAEAHKSVVTSTTGGAHDSGSKHFLGLAIDVRTRDKSNEEIDLYLQKCRLVGIIVRDERIKPEGQKVWTGAHLHLEIGANTMQTLMDFQRRNNLLPDGICGEQTLLTLDLLLRGEAEN